MKWSNEARIGIGVLAAAVIFIAGVVYLRGIDLRSKQYELKVFYRNVNGLKEGDVVSVAGLAIGRVESMALAGRGINVVLSIQTKVHLPKDSRAILKSESIMGGKFIEIAPGMDAAMLVNGDSLGGLYEADLSELTATLSPITSNVLGILENVNSTFDQPTRQRIQNIVAELEHSSGRLEEVIRAGGRSADASFAELSSFSRDLASAARTIDSIARDERLNIDTSVTSFARWSKNMERVSAQLETAAGALNGVLGKVGRGQGTLGMLVQDERLYNHLDSLSMNLNLLVRDLRENPQRYVRLSLF
ncbi:MAG TPA: MlaD family protein [Bacteroidota bacterium]|nr:MlaD family protein [Bacteroidota bacterium]